MRVCPEREFESSLFVPNCETVGKLFSVIETQVEIRRIYPTKICWDNSRNNPFEKD